MHPASRWYEPVATTPRHLFTPRWWKHVQDQGWTLRVGSDDQGQWLSNVYSDRTLVTRIGALHANYAAKNDHPEGKPTSSSTLPSLVVDMYRHGMITDTSDVLCITGTGYGTALLCNRLGDDARVTSVDVDAYLVERAQATLDGIGLHPTMATCDITGTLPGEYDRIISTVSVPHIPASWLRALRPGGRLVTTITGTGLIITADKSPDGGASGKVTWDRAGFMATRHGTDYEPGPAYGDLWTRDDGRQSTGRYPVIRIGEAWEIMSALALAVPGVQHIYGEKDGELKAAMWHADGSWARATGHRGEPPIVVQGGPRKLWNILDKIRHDWVSDGWLQVYGANVSIAPDGTTTLSRGGWSAAIKPE